MVYWRQFIPNFDLDFTVYFYFRSLIRILNYADSLAAMGSRNFSNLEAYKSKIPENVYVNVTLSS